MVDPKAGLVAPVTVRLSLFSKVGPRVAYSCSAEHLAAAPRLVGSIFCHRGRSGKSVNWPRRRRELIAVS